MARMSNPKMGTQVLTNVGMSISIRSNKSGSKGSSKSMGRSMSKRVRKKMREGAQVDILLRKQRERPGFSKHCVF